MLLHSINSEALLYWREKRYSRADLLRVASDLDEQALLMIVDFTPGQTVNATISKKVQNTKQGHITAVLQFLNHLQLTHESNALNGSVLVLLEDGIYPAYAPATLHAPILCFNRPQSAKSAFLIPDPAFTHSTGYQEELARLSAADAVTPWESKQPICFWRGAASGSYASSPEWRKNQRCNLALFSRSDESGTLDVAITHLPENIKVEIKEEMQKEGIIANYTPITDFTLYRYNIDIDGEFNAWKSCFLKLATETLLFKVHTQNEQWYYHGLKEWEHYVPVRADLSDLLQNITWARENDSTARAIARRSKDFITGLSFESQARETVSLVEELLTLQSGS